MLGQVVAAQSLGIHAGGYPATDPPPPKDGPSSPWRKGSSTSRWVRSQSSPSPTGLRGGASEVKSCSEWLSCGSQGYQATQGRVWLPGGGHCRQNLQGLLVGGTSRLGCSPLRSTQAVDNGGD